jgi:hypothetical protein
LGKIGEVDGEVGRVSSLTQRDGWRNLHGHGSHSIVVW